MNADRELTTRALMALANDMAEFAALYERISAQIQHLTKTHGLLSGVDIPGFEVTLRRA